MEIDVISRLEVDMDLVLVWGSKSTQVLYGEIDFVLVCGPKLPWI